MEEVLQCSQLGLMELLSPDGLYHPSPPLSLLTAIKYHQPAQSLNQKRIWTLRNERQGVSDATPFWSCWGGIEIWLGQWKRQCFPWIRRPLSKCHLYPRGWLDGCDYPQEAGQTLPTIHKTHPHDGKHLYPLHGICAVLYTNIVEHHRLPMVNVSK